MNNVNDNIVEVMRPSMLWPTIYPAIGCLMGGLTKDSALIVRNLTTYLILHHLAPLYISYCSVQAPTPHSSHTVAAIMCHHIQQQGLHTSQFRSQRSSIVVQICVLQTTNAAECWQ